MTNRVVEFARSAGRHGAHGTTISPLAAPAEFAFANGLKLVKEKRVVLWEGYRVLVCFEREDAKRAVIAGELTDSRDDSATMTVHDLEFAGPEETAVWLNAAADYLYEHQSADHRRELLFAA